MLKNLKIREKLIGGFLIMGCVILFVGAIGWYGAHTITKYVGDIGDVRLPSVQSLLEMQNGMKSAWIGERGLNIRGIWEKSEVLTA